LPILFYCSFLHSYIGGLSPEPSIPAWIELGLTGMSASFRSVLVAWAFAPVVGLLCVFTHWLLIRPPEPKA
jgi:hypothetical protein